MDDDGLSSYQVFECRIQEYGDIYIDDIYIDDIRRIDYIHQDIFIISYYTYNKVIAEDGSFLGGKMTKSVCGAKELYGFEINEKLGICTWQNR